MSTILKAENISKQYRLGEVGTGTLGHDLNRWWASLRGNEDPYLQVGAVNDRSAKATEDYVWALRDINFEVKQGEVLGIIGKNGAGKSTLLKILSRVTAPTTGSIKTRGRIASLLEVGTGFHGELSGRENIFMNGAILGMTKNEIKSKLDEIIDFSGCEMYIDTPVKRYSSGMTVRLGFAVAAHLEPEILVVDEVLAVGDAEFQKKAIGKMQDLSTGEGRTVLFVSHNMSSVRSLCSRGILLENGKVKMEGKVAEVLNEYLETKLRRTKWNGEDGVDSINLIETEVYCKESGKSFKNGDEILIQMKFEIMEKFRDLVIGISIYSSVGNPIIGILYNDYNDYSEIGPGLYEVIIAIPSFTLATGGYEIEFNISVPFVKRYTSEKSKLFFEMTADTTFGNRFLVQNDMYLNSVVRPNWFKSLNKIK
jgi:lipopolysaccharide transport system ATP-binding protein